MLHALCILPLCRCIFLRLIRSVPLSHISRNGRPVFWREANQTLPRLFGQDTLSLMFSPALDPQRQESSLAASPMEHLLDIEYHPVRGGRRDRSIRKGWGLNTNHRKNKRFDQYRTWLRSRSAGRKTTHLPCGLRPWGDLWQLVKRPPTSEQRNYAMAKDVQRFLALGPVSPAVPSRPRFWITLSFPLHACIFICVGATTQRDTLRYSFMWTPFSIGTRIYPLLSI
jgi:hypothetical protein